MDDTRQAETRSTAQLLQVIAEGTTSLTGEAFFRSLARHAAQALRARYAFVAEMLSPLESRSLAYWEGSDFGEGFSYRFPGTPCQRVAEGHVCSTRSGLQQAFPEDAWLGQIGAESYVGVPMKNAEGRTIGHLAVLHTEAMEPTAEDIAVLEIFAARGCAELERKQADEARQRDLTKQLEAANKALEASEERFRDLFDEAPIAYVNEGLDSKFIRANKTAMKSLGITPDQVEGTYGASFIPDTPDAQRRLKEAFDSIGKGIDTSGVVLELRRRDNGKPLWIKWWSRPDPSGTYTRTMFVDITEQVLMEQEKARLDAAHQQALEEMEAVRAEFAAAREQHAREIAERSELASALLQQREDITLERDHEPLPRAGRVEAGENGGMRHKAQRGAM